MNRYLLAIAFTLGVSTQVHAQTSTGMIGNQPFIINTPPSGPKGFGAGFADSGGGAAVGNLLGGIIASTRLGSFVPGNITSQNGGQLQFEIEIIRGNGAVKAFNPKTHERFAGTYVAVLNGDLASGNAVLNGNRNSLLSCQMQIQPGWTPHGIGSCVDKKNISYQMQF